MKQNIEETILVCVRGRWQYLFASFSRLLVALTSQLQHTFHARFVAVDRFFDIFVLKYDEKRVLVIKQPLEHYF